MLRSRTHIKQDLQKKIQPFHPDRAHSLHQKHHLHQKPITQAAQDLHLFFFPLSKCVMLQTQVSTSSRTSAQSRRGDTLPTKTEISLTYFSHFIKQKVSYLSTGGEEAALLCSCSLLSSCTKEQPSLPPGRGHPAHLGLI